MAALTYRSINVSAIRRSCAVCVAAAVLAVAGCGGDDEPEPTPPAPTVPAETVPSEPTTSATDTGEAEADGGATAPATSPETQTGGAGDEVPAESVAMLTGSGGRITPRVVRVPAFISIRVELRSKDGGPYVLRFGRRTLAVRSEQPTVSGRFDGLRPGASLVGKSATGAGNSVRIEATAEPGP